MKHFTKRSAVRPGISVSEIQISNTGGSKSTEVASIKCNSNKATLRDGGRGLGRSNGPSPLKACKGRA